jgi:hypothetical protein
MSQKASLHIVLEPEETGGSPVSLARVNDPKLLASAATAAIQNARKRSTEMSRQGEVIGQLARDEADRLEKALTLALRGRGKAAR